MKNKIKYTHIIIGLLIMIGIYNISLASNLSSDITLNNNDISTYENKGYILSDKFTTYESCNTEKIKNNIEYPSYNRSYCFNTDSGYKYFICQSTVEVCSVTSVTNNVNTTTSQVVINNTSNLTNGLSSSVVSNIKNKDKLDIFILKVGSLKTTMTPEKFKTTLDGLVSKLTKLEKKYSSNVDVKNMIVYLNNGLKELYNSNDIDNFLCELTDSCNSISNNQTSSINNQTNTKCGEKPSADNPQSMDDYKNYMLKNYLEVKCTDYSYSSTILKGLEGKIQLSGSPEKLICDSSTNYKWVFPNMDGLIPNGIHSCKVSDKCPSVPNSSKVGRKYTKTYYGFYSDEIVKTCSEAGKGNEKGVYMEGSYPKCDESTNYKWKNLDYVEIGNTCNAPIVSVPPTCIDLQYQYQCEQAKNNNYKQLIYANGNKENIISISDCTSTTFGYMTSSSSTSRNGHIGSGWRACSHTEQTNTNKNTNITPLNKTTTIYTSKFSRVVEYYMCGNKEKDSNGVIKGLRGVATYDKNNWNAESKPIGWIFDRDEYGRTSLSGSPASYTPCNILCSGPSAQYNTLCGTSKLIESTEDITKEVANDEIVTKEISNKSFTKEISSEVVSIGVSEKNIIYKGNNKLDIYMPSINNTSGKNKIPVYISVHGGSWRFLDKSDDEWMAEKFNNKGIAFVSIDYTLTNSSTPGSHLVYKEIDCSLKWITANQKLYNLDLSKVNLIGSSAGGHLVLQYALNQSEYNDTSCSWGTSQAKINQVVSLAGPIDLTQDFSKTEAGNLNIYGEEFLGVPRSNSNYTKIAKNNSPINFINKDNKNIKYYLYYAKNDGIVNYYNHVIPLYNLMTKNNYSVLLDSEGDGHNGRNMTNGFTKIINQANINISTTTNN